MDPTKSDEIKSGMGPSPGSGMGAVSEKVGKAPVKKKKSTASGTPAAIPSPQSTTSKTNTSSIGARPDTPTGRGTVNMEGGGGHRVKKLFHKMKENMGMVEKTEYSQALKDAFQEIDEYKKCIDELAVTILITVQKNPYYRNINDPKMRCSPPAGNDPYEELETLLRENETALGTFGNYQPTVASFKKLGELHREYLYRSRKAVHNMRSFINHYYWIIGIERKELEKKRQDMDFAKHELKSSKDPAIIQVKNTVYEESCKTFDGQLQKVTELMDTLPKHKETHANEITELMEAQRRFHEKAAIAIKQ